MGLTFISLQDEECHGSGGESSWSSDRGNQKCGFGRHWKIADRRWGKCERGRSWGWLFFQRWRCWIEGSHNNIFRQGSGTDFLGFPSVQRLDAAKSRIESLNPLVKVETITDVAIQDEGFERVLQSVDLVCVTDLDRNSLVSPPLYFWFILQRDYQSFESMAFADNIRNPFMPVAHTDSRDTFSVIFWIMNTFQRGSNLQESIYLLTFSIHRDRSKTPSKTVKTTAVYPPLESAIQHRWSGFTRRQTKEINPALFFVILGVQKRRIVLVSSDSTSVSSSLAISIVARHFAKWPWASCRVRGDHKPIHFCGRSEQANTYERSSRPHRVGLYF